MTLRAPLRARDITDIGEDLGLERISVTSKEGWDHSSMFHVMFGPPAYRQILQIAPSLDAEAVKAKLEAARAHSVVGVTIPGPEPKPSPAATPAPAKGKRKRVENA